MAFGPHGDDEWDIGEDPVVDEPGGVGVRPTIPTAEAAEPVVEESTDRDFVPDVVAVTGDVVASAERMGDRPHCTHRGTRRTTSVSHSTTVSGARCSPATT